MIKFPYSKPEITTEDINTVVDTLKSGYLTQGDKLIEFENSISKSFGSKNTIVCNSGTAALHMIYSELGLNSKNALLTSSITFLATANAARMCNAPVVLADVDPETGLMTAETIENALKMSKYKIAVITVVHLAGRVCNLKAISKVAKKFGCLIVEDACHAPGAYLNDKNIKENRIGACKYSVACTFSFHAIKHITMGEGGCITTNNSKISESLRLARSHGIIRDLSKLESKPEKNPIWYYEMQKLGWNYRADGMSCALGTSQLKRLNINIKKRRKLVKIYDKKFKNNIYINTPKKPINKENHVWHLYAIAVDFEKISKTRGEIMQILLERGIGTQVHYIPLFLQPYYKDKFSKKYDGAIKYYNKTLSIPLYPNLSLEDIEHIADTINKIIIK